MMGTFDSLLAMQSDRLKPFSSAPKKNRIVGGGWAQDGAVHHKLVMERSHTSAGSKKMHNE